MKEMDNNTIVAAGLVVALITALFFGTENVQIAIASGLVGFITGTNTKAL